MLLDIQSVSTPSRTDWIQTWIFVGQLIATIGGFYLLYRGLRLQAKATKYQHDVTGLELKKFIYDIRPIFIRVDKRIDRGQINPIQYINYTIILTNNSAHNFSITKEIYKPETGFFNRADIPILAIEEEIPVIDIRHTPEDLKQEVVIKIRFQDEIGTKYEQKIHGVLADLHITPPYKISS